MQCNLSIMGLYKYDPTIFNQLQLPSGMDKATAINTILLKCAELELLYPDADMMKDAIKVWSDMMQAPWLKLYNTTILEYNPIWNKDGVITESETVNVSRETEGDSSTQVDVDSTDELDVAGFNSETLVKSEKTTIDSTTGSGTHAESSGSDDTTREYRREEHGNIGVTTTQSMIKEEREISLFNMYETIADDFKKRFCILVY